MSVRRSLAWAFSQHGTSFLLQFLGSIVLARLLRPEEVGIYALAMAAHMVASSLRDFGIGSYLIREPELDKDKVQTAFTLWCIASVMLGSIVFFSRGWVASFYEEPGISDVLLVIAATFLVTPLGQPAHSLLTREMRFDILHHINLACTVMGLSISIGLAYLGFSYMALAWGLLSSSLLRSLLLIVLRRNDFDLRLTLKHARAILDFGGFMTGASLIGTLNKESVKFILGAALSPAAIALYERAVQLPSMLRQIVSVPLSVVLFPKFSRDIREGRSIGLGVSKLVGGTTALMWPAFVVLGLCANSIIEVLFGENWVVAGEILPYLLVANAILVILPQPEQILPPHGRVRTLFGIRFLGFLNNLFFTIVGALHSFELFAMLRPVETAIFFVGNFLVIHRYLGVTLSELSRGYNQALIVSLISSLPALLVNIVLDWKLNFFYLLLTAVASMACWVFALYSVRHFLYDEVIKQAVRHLIGTRVR